MSFKAQFVGVCHCGCGEKIAREDWINYSDDVEGYVLEGHEQRARADRNDPRCDRCGLNHPGECL